jgi:hypothetical protein
VSQHRDRYRRREGEHACEERDRAHGADVARDEGLDERRGDGQWEEGRHDRQPLHLQALDPPGAAGADRHRHGREHERGEEQPDPSPAERVRGRSGNARHGVWHGGVGRLERVRREQVGEPDEHRGDGRHDDRRAPAGSGGAAVGEQEREPGHRQEEEHPRSLQQGDRPPRATDASSARRGGPHRRRKVDRRGRPQEREDGPDRVCGATPGDQEAGHDHCDGRAALEQGLTGRRRIGGARPDDRRCGERRRRCRGARPRGGERPAHVGIVAWPRAGPSPTRADHGPDPGAAAAGGSPRIRKGEVAGFTQEQYELRSDHGLASTRR